MLAAIWAQDEQGVIGKERQIALAFTQRLEIFQGKNNS